MSFVFTKGREYEQIFKEVIIMDGSISYRFKLTWICETKYFSQGADTPSYTRYYKSVLIHRGDSLWKIAEQYCPDGAMSVGKYMEELKQINQLKDDTIHSGCYLTIVYFEPEDS